MDDIEKELREAMDENARVKSTAKATLRTPPLVAEKVPAALDPEPQPSAVELKLQAKVELMKELLAEKGTLETMAKDAGLKLKRDVSAAAADEEMVEFHVNLPIQSKEILLDGRSYPHGWRGLIRKSQLPTFREIQARAWLHDDQVKGRQAFEEGFRIQTPISARVG